MWRYPMSNLPLYQRIAWREFVNQAGGPTPSRNVGFGNDRRAAILAVDARMAALEAVVREIAESEPVHRMECDYCGCLIYDVPLQHAADCVWVKCLELMND